MESDVYLVTTRFQKIIGDPAKMTVNQAQQQAINLSASLQAGQSDKETVFDTIAVERFCC